MQHIYTSLGDLIAVDHLLLGRGFFGSNLLWHRILFGSGNLLDGRFLGSRFPGGSSFLDGRLPGGGRLFDRGLLDGFLWLRLIDRLPHAGGLLDGGGGDLERAGTFPAGDGAAGNNPLRFHHILQTEADSALSHSRIYFVVGQDVVENGLAGGAVPVLQVLDGGHYHGRVGGVSGLFPRVGGNFLGPFGAHDGNFQLYRTNIGNREIEDNDS